MRDCLIRSIAFAGALVGVLVSGTAVPAVAQASDDHDASPRRSAFGLTLHRVPVLVPGTATAGGALQDAGLVGVHYTHSRRAGRRLGVLTDVEFQFGVVAREALPAYTVSYAIGGHGLAGPRLNLRGSRVSLHALGGLSLIRLTGDSVTTGTGGGGPTIYYVGGDPIFRSYLNNQRDRSTPREVHFPGSTRTLPMVVVGAASEWGPLRISGDFLRADGDGVRWGVVRLGAGFRF